MLLPTSDSFHLIISQKWVKKDPKYFTWTTLFKTLSCFWICLDPFVFIRPLWSVLINLIHLHPFGSILLNKMIDFQIKIHFFHTRYCDISLSLLDWNRCHLISTKDVSTHTIERNWSGKYNANYWKKLKYGKWEHTTKRWIQKCFKPAAGTLLLMFPAFNMCRSFSVQQCFPWFPDGQTVRRYPDRNWLRGLCHPQHLPHESVAVMERATIETNLWALPGPFTGLNHCATLFLNTGISLANRLLILW